MTITNKYISKDELWRFYKPCRLDAPEIQTPEKSRPQPVPVSEALAESRPQPVPAIFYEETDFKNIPWYTLPVYSMPVSFTDHATITGWSNSPLEEYNSYDTSLLEKVYITKPTYTPKIYNEHNNMSLQFDNQTEKDSWAAKPIGEALTQSAFVDLSRATDGFEAGVEGLPKHSKRYVTAYTDAHALITKDMEYKIGNKRGWHPVSPTTIGMYTGSFSSNSFRTSTLKTSVDGYTIIQYLETIPENTEWLLGNTWVPGLTFTGQTLSYKARGFCRVASNAVADTTPDILEE